MCKRWQNRDFTSKRHECHHLQFNVILLFIWEVKFVSVSDRYYLDDVVTLYFKSQLNERWFIEFESQFHRFVVDELEKRLFRFSIHSIHSFLEIRSVQLETDERGPAQSKA